ncbi:conserved hypothetical protein [Methanocella paludicola SANAE]|uniref:Winged helix DNA-binding domain-containing protein n=1 Tax=Methanocella paludicola (strain DSM 17711 / JCM 13418 / NBRC 101707 / SANAE) TaxID=304371 RepID=D1YV19_METPS|nr:winged helix DNA-binding domain-containing protein [Methanocella paludicola]BAI60291.1 conserved hypothetical protein [Methanocella paludicola SANAE]
MMLEKEAVNFFVMAKSHLTPDSRLDSAGAVLRDMIALDANNLDDAYFSLYLRVKRFDVVALEKGMYRGTSMARVKGLKNYMQVIPQEFLPAVYAVSKKDREAAARNLLSTWGIAEDEYRKVGSKVLESLDGKEKTLVQLKKGLSPVSRDIVRKKKEKATNVSIVAQAMQDRWLLLRGGIGRHPGENPGRFSAFKERFKMKLDVGRDEALSLLAKRYVKSYGPVGAEDLAWWLGVTKSEASWALDSLDSAEAVDVEGVPGRLFIDKRDESLIDGKFMEPSVVFLPRDDPYVKAYYNDGRFVPEGHDAMTKFGESKSVVLVNGTVWGTWSLEKDRMTFVCRVEWFDGHPEVPAERVEAAALDAGRFYTGGEVEVKGDT